MKPQNLEARFAMRLPSNPNALIDTPYIPNALMGTSYLQHVIDTTPDPSVWQEGDSLFGMYRVARKYSGGSSYVYLLEQSGVVGHLADGHHVFDFGTAWRTSEPVFVAAKVPHLKLRESEAHRQRFVEECRIWAEVGHLAHVVQAYGVRYIGNVPVLFMEPVLPWTLREIINRPRSQKASLENVLTWCLDFWHAMKGMLGQGLTAHGDVTPANLLIDRDNRLKVTDFGLAWMREHGQV
jgi:serine/threonine protein kinase